MTIDDFAREHPYEDTLAALRSLIDYETKALRADQQVIARKVSTFLNGYRTTQVSVLGELAASAEVAERYEPDEIPVVMAVRSARSTARAFIKHSIHQAAVFDLVSRRSAFEALTSGDQRLFRVLGFIQAADPTPLDHRTPFLRQAIRDPDLDRWSGYVDHLGLVLGGFVAKAIAEDNQTALDATIDELTAVIDADDGPDAAAYLEEETIELYEQHRRRRTNAD